MAEVLITLGIIGVVAAMTMPALLNKTKNAELVTAYKKVYSELSQVYMTIKADNGGTLEGLCNSSNDYYELFKKYMKNIRICDAGTASGRCWAENWYYINGSKVYSTEAASSSMILPSGASILFMYMSNSCESSVELRRPIGCGRLRVDLNGVKKPNTVGRDIFDFYITKEGLLPRGSEKTGTDTLSDWGKGAYLLQTGKMDY